ncbi:hypothetical protein D3C87_1926090 [compost metagenome]
MLVVNIGVVKLAPVAKGTPVKAALSYQLNCGALKDPLVTVNDAEEPEQIVVPAPTISAFSA